MTQMLSILVLACALAAAASPVQKEEKRGLVSLRGNARRSLAERAAARGTSIRAQKQVEKAAVKAKYQRNVANAKAYTHRQKRQATAATLPLTDLIQQGVDELYYGTLQFGSPAQNVTVDFDTGSADLWVPNSQCTDCIQDGVLFKTASSSTYKTTGQRFQVQYGSGAVQGVVATDTVAFGNLSVASQYFGSVTRVTSTFDDNPASGICGLAFQSISEIQQPPLAFNLASQNKLASKVFGLHLNRGSETGSTLTLGGVASNYTSSNLTYTPVTSQTYWEVKATGFEVNGQTLYPQGFSAAIDSGTTVIYVPSAAAAAFHGAISGAEEIEEGEYVFPCGFSGTVGISFAGAGTLQISSADLNIGEVGQGMCESSVTGVDIEDASGQPFAILGDSFMKNYYTVFDWSTTPPRVGFTAP